MALSGIVALALWSPYPAVLVASAVLFGFMLTQNGMLGHDVAHRQVFRRGRGVAVTGWILGNLLTGISYSWWTRKHNLHHANPNHVTDDPDAKVIVLDFWATWCGPCVAALPELQEVYDWAQDNGKPVAFYAVNQGETVEEVKQFWLDKGLSIPVLMDEDFTAAQAYQVSGIPQTVIIAGGKIRQVHVGYAPGIGEQLKAEIEGLLNDGSE